MGKLTTITRTGKTVIPKYKISKEIPPNSFMVRRPIEGGVAVPKNDIPEIHYGQHIYFYNNIRTNQVVYSLTRHLNNKDSLDQLAFVGKKTVPSRLRKDLWTPFCHVSFPTPSLGLSAYHHLREYRRLHELSYPLSLITHPAGSKKGQLMSTKERGRVLMDQKANSIADLAAVLLQQEAGPGKERVERGERRRERVEKLKKRKGEGKVKKAPIDVEKEFGGGVEGVKVFWANVLDAEFAKTWPEKVVHGDLRVSRYTAAFPVGPERVKEVKEVKEVEVEPEKPKMEEEKQVRRWAWLPKFPSLPRVFSRQRGNVGAA